VTRQQGAVRKILSSVCAFLALGRLFTSGAPAVADVPRTDTAAITSVLTADDRSPLGQRTPLILIHGWRSDPSRWDDFAAFVKANAPFQQRFKLYRFRYDWHDPIDQNAERLEALVQNGKLFPRGTHVDIVAHSMGGLVSRAYIESVKPGWNGAEQVDTLITIGTPHHGSPLASPAWLQSYSELAPAEFVIKYLTSMALPLDNRGGYNLGWDDFDNAMPKPVWDGMHDPSGDDVPAADRFISQLNQNLAVHPRRGALLAKYILYGGYYKDLNVAGDPHPTLVQMFKLAIEAPLRAGNFILAKEMHLENGETISNYVANDGVVPLSSALLLDPDTPKEPVADVSPALEVRVDTGRIDSRAHTRIHLFAGINHSEMPSSTDVMAAIVSDIMPSDSAPSSPTPPNRSDPVIGKP
jgi:pimeloyl-ACP methyl ester carboxylesterase